MPATFRTFSYRIFLKRNKILYIKKGLLKIKKYIALWWKVYHVLTCLFVCLFVFRFLQVTCVDVLWSLTSSRKLEISVVRRKGDV